MALQLGARSLDVVHVGGQDEPALRDYLGMGIGTLTVLDAGPNADALYPLVDWLTEKMPSLIFTGTRTEGDDSTGLLPYLLAEALGTTLIADAVEVAIDDGSAVVTQGLPRGRRRKCVATLPAIIVAGPTAPEPRQVSNRHRRDGTIVVRHVDPAPRNRASIRDERPARPLPKRLDAPRSNELGARLSAVLQNASSQGTVLDGIAPDEAARRLLVFLESEGLWRGNERH
jgi:electron transfer flavoprotein beta subunit